MLASTWLTLGSLALAPAVLWGTTPVVSASAQRDSAQQARGTKTDRDADQARPERLPRGAQLDLLLERLGARVLAVDERLSSKAVQQLVRELGRASRVASDPQRERVVALLEELATRRAGHPDAARARLEAALALATVGCGDPARRTRSIAILEQIAGSDAPAALRRLAADRAWQLRNLVPGQPLPANLWADVDGNELNLEHLEGRVVVLRLWDPRDPAVRQRLERDRRLWRRFYDSRVTLIGIPKGLKGPELRRWIDDERLEWDQAFEDPKQPGTAQRWRLGGAGWTFVLDRQGTLRFAEPVVRVGERQLAGWIERLLREGRPDQDSQQRATRRPMDQRQDPNPEGASDRERAPRPAPHEPDQESHKKEGEIASGSASARSDPSGGK